MNHSLRAENLTRRLLSVGDHTHSSLFWLLYKSHRGTFHWQWALTIGQSIAAYGPQFCMYELLRLLEEQRFTVEQRTALWFWAFGLGSIRLLQTLLEARYAV